VAFLLDTNILSELRKPHCDKNVLAWMAAIHSDECHISVIVVGEIRRGIDMIRRRDPARAGALDRWLTKLQTAYADRILPVTTEIALEWGRISAQGSLSPIDALMAATASHYDLTMVTRNVVDFAPTGISILNPFEFIA